MTTAIRFAIRVLCVLAAVAALAQARPAAAEGPDESEVRMPVDKNVLPLDFSRPPIEPAEKKPEARPAKKPAEAQKPAEKKAVAAKPEPPKPEIKKPEPVKPAPKPPEPPKPAAAKPAPKPPAQAAAEKPKPVAPAETPAGEIGLVREVKLNVWKNGSVLKIAADRPAHKAAVFAAQGPRRLVVDLPGRWKSQAPSIQRFESGPIKSVRVGAHSDRLRVVLDLREESGAAPAVPALERGDFGLSLTVPNE
jgi:hypothetical protein